MVNIIHINAMHAFPCCVHGQLLPQKPRQQARGGRATPHGFLRASDMCAVCAQTPAACFCSPPLRSSLQVPLPIRSLHRASDMCARPLEAVQSPRERELKAPPACFHLSQVLSLCFKAVASRALAPKTWTVVFHVAWSSVSQAESMRAHTRIRTHTHPHTQFLTPPPPKHILPPHTGFVDTCPK